MPARPTAAGRFGALARNLGTLASETRLELLHALRTPRTIQEIRVGPTLTRGAENPERPLSRQAVARHLEQLEEAGLVARKRGPRQRGETYVLNHERLFALVDDLRSLAKLRPLLAELSTLGQTVDRGAGPAGALPRGPRLLLAYGRDDGVAFALDGPPGAAWRIGRSPACEVRLDWDPYVSAGHCVVELRPEGFALLDLGSRNGTWVNWEPLPRGGSVPLRPGDVLTVGRSTLVFQDAPARQPRG